MAQRRASASSCEKRDRAPAWRPTHTCASWALFPPPC
jgi:hypothetical protein